MLSDLQNYVNISTYVLTERNTRNILLLAGTQIIAVITCAHSPSANNVTHTLPKEVTTTHHEKRRMRWSPSISEPPSNTTPPPLLRQPSDKEQLKLKAKQKGEQAHYKILKSCQQWLQKSCCSTHQSRGKVTDLWIWGQSYLSLLSPKGSTASDCLDVVQSKKKLRQTGVRAGWNVRSMF